MAKAAPDTRSAHLPDSTYLLEYFYCILFFCSLFVMIAIGSFDPSDATLFSTVVVTGTQVRSVANVFGPIGANIADWSFQLFGIGAIIFSFVYLTQILGAFRKPTQPSRWMLRLFGYPQLMLCYLGLMTAISSQWLYKGMVFYTGGIVGNVSYETFRGLFGHTGALVALSFGVMASLPLCLGVRPFSLVLKVLSWMPSSRAKNFLRQIDEKESSVRKPVALSEISDYLKPAASAAPLARESTMPKRDAVEPDLVPLRKKDGLSPLTSLSDAGISRMDDVTKSAASDSKPLSAAEFKGLVQLLEFHQSSHGTRDPEQEAIRLSQESALLEEKLSTFGVLGKVVKSQPGPVVNVHEFEPAAGIKVTKVIGLQDDLALGLRAQSVLMAPQPGKSTIGIEIPAQFRETVSLRELMEHPSFQNNRNPLPMALGKLVDGSPLIADLSAMPHLLVAGSTGSGKSVGINGILLSLMMSRTPSQLRLILVDPKMLELSNYDGIGHLLLPVVTDPSKAAGALRWAIDEMERRYKLMKTLQVRNIGSYNSTVEAGGGSVTTSEGTAHESLPYIVIVIDELCDLMMTAPKDVEDSIQRLAQKARAAGIHLILATQRPSVDVLTGVIKANLPCRISFQVASKHDSRTIIETIGAERLLGKGDMLFLPPGTSKLLRAHGAYVGDKEINAIADSLRVLYPAKTEMAIMEQVDRVSQDIGQKGDEKRGKGEDSENDGNGMDENTLYDRAVEFAIEAGTVSTSSIQRHYRIGYNRAARIVDRMAKEGLVGPSDVAGKPRQVIAGQR